MSVRHLALVLALVVAAVAGCTAEPAGPRPTMPHPSYAPIVLPGKATPKPTKGRAATPKPSKAAALTDAEWRVAFCKTQDEVFALDFAVRNVLRAGATKNVSTFKASLRTLGRRADRARRNLLAVPARYARPLVQVELGMIRATDQVASLALRALQTRSSSDLRRLRAAGRTGDRLRRQMVKVNHRLQQGEHRLICL